MTRDARFVSDGVVAVSHLPRKQGDHYCILMVGLNRRYRVGTYNEAKGGGRSLCRAGVGVQYALLA